MAFSTFVFDTLDVCTRLGRYILQELFGRRDRASALLATLATIALPVYFILMAGEGSWVKFWTLFGASNQLLAALSLLTITIWLYRARKRIAFTLWPMLFVLTITLWSLLKLTISNFSVMHGIDLAFVNGLVSIALMLLAIYLVIRALATARVARVAEAISLAGVE
jgi:carbon starvation protein